MTPRPVPLSPNCGERRGGIRPSLVVLHHTAMATAAEAAARLCDPAAEVSAHYLIDEQGEVLALVPEELRAWHAGAGAWGGAGDVNSRSVGIELANPGARPFPEPQMRALEALLGAVQARWSIPPAGVIAHSDMAPGRKADPGARFDWRRLALAGLSVWPEPGGDGRAALGPSLDAIGYPEAPAAVRLAAFRLRFRPWATGPETAADRAAAADLARRFPARPAAVADGSHEGAAGPLTSRGQGAEVGPARRAGWPRVAGDGGARKVRTP